MTALGAARADLSEVERIVRRSGTSFYRGMRILPADRRAAMYAVYAFCRLVDDVADEPGPVDAKRTALNAWRDRVRALEKGEAGDMAVTRVLARAIAAFELRPADLQSVIDGMEMDAGDPMVAPDFATLDLYCDRVASAVGRLSVRAFGDASAAADQVAHHLGRALQLTNILRDLGEDAARGRLYLPREWLFDAGVPLDPEAAIKDPRLAQVCERMAKRIHAHFGGAGAAMARCNAAAMRPARLMAASYAAILSRLERRGWRTRARRVSVPPWEKLWIALRYAR
jgi:phytoene synthase